MPLSKTPWYYGWNIVGVTLVFQGILFGSVFFSYTLWVGEWREDASLGATAAGLFVPFTIISLGQSFIAPFAGHAMDRHSIRGLICTGGILAGLGFAAISQVTAFWQITLIYGSLLTIGILLAGPLAAQTLATKWFRGRRGLAIGLTTVGTSLGGMVMPPIVTMLYQAQGWRDAHLILGASFIIVIVPLVWLTIRNTPEDAGVDPEPEPTSAAHGPTFEYPQWTTKTILQQRTFWVIALAFTPMVFVFGGVQQNLGPFSSELGNGKLETAFLVSTVSTVMIAGKLFFGGMSDRIDHRKLFWTALVILISSLLTMMLEPGYQIMLVACGLLGFAAGAFLPLIGAIIASRFGPVAFGSVMGLIGPFLAAQSFGPMSMAWLREAIGSWEMVFVVAVALILPPFIAIAFLPKRPDRQGAQHASTGRVTAAGE